MTAQQARNVARAAAVLELLDRQDRGERWRVERVTAGSKGNGRAEALGPLFEGADGGCGVAGWCGEAGREIESA